VGREQWRALTPEQRAGFAPLSPYFVVELRSPSDQLAPLQEKMQEYSDNGVQLGWLIDPLEKRVHIYRPGQPVESKDNPATLSGEPVLPAFVLDLRPLW
jgi:Uma2 family endonuclease